MTKKLVPLDDLLITMSFARFQDLFVMDTRTDLQQVALQVLSCHVCPFKHMARKKSLYNSRTKRMCACAVYICLRACLYMYIQIQ